MNIELISIIIPVFNSKKFIVKAIDSCLNQTYDNIEVILVDDGSTDGSLELIISNYFDNQRVIVVTHENRENKGVVETRKLGVSLAKGKYIAFLDSDDWFELNKIEKQLSIMEKNTDVVLIHSAANFHNESKSNSFYNGFKYSDSDLKYKVDLKTFIKSNHICNSSVIVRRDMYNKILITSNLTFQYEDWVYWILLSEFGYFYYLVDETCYYRFHDDSSTAKLVNNSNLSLFADLEKNFVLYGLLKKSKKSKIVKNELYESIEKIQLKLFGNNNLSIKFYLDGFIRNLKI